MNRILPSLLTCFMALFFWQCAPKPASESAGGGMDAKEAMESGEELEQSSSNKTSPAAAPSKIPAHYKEIKHPEFQYHPPDPSAYRVALDSGLSAYLVPDTTLGLIQISVLLDRTNLPRSRDEVAKLAMYDAMLISGGTKNLPAKAVEDSLEFIAAGLQASLNDYSTEFHLDALSGHAYDLLDLLREALLQPGFDSEIFDLNKKKYLEGVKHRYDQPGSILGIAYEKLMYGEHPANWLASEKQIKALEKKAVAAYKLRGLRSGKTAIAVSGRFHPDSVKTALKQFMDNLDSAAARDTATPPPYDSAAAPGVYLVDKEFQQASIKVGFPGLQRPHPDYYKLTLANYIFGAGGFTSRLTARVRTDEGLAYSVRSFVDSDYHRPGTVGFSLQTKVASAGKAILLCFEELDKLLEEGLTEEDLARAKKGLIESLPSLFDTPEATAGIFARSEIWGRDLDHFKNYPKIIDALTLQDVHEAFKKYFVPEEARVVIVAKKEDVEGQIPESHPSSFRKNRLKVLQTTDLDQLKLP